jgi:sugar phosphate isomerase/epimerase|tara:strand:- start:1093 stop:1995 length:903 start_codon:yes stop_codon:yes gene_type:complete
MENRRNFIKKTSLLSLGMIGYSFNLPIIKNIGGVDISVITYSFQAGTEDMETIIQYCLDSKSDNIELMGNHVERTIGMPRSRRDSADWRANVSMKEFKKVKKEFDQKGINIFAYKPYCMSPRNKDEEIEYAMKATKALGADYVTAELTDETNTKRISYYAEKHDVKVGYHGHLQSTDIAWNFALDNSKNNYINLDIGHYIAVGGVNTKETLLKFIENNHDRICSLHLKDRNAPTETNPDDRDNKIWGQGDTPIKEVLLLMQKKSYNFTATIEREYPIPEGSNAVQEVIRCMDYCKSVLDS